MSSFVLSVGARYVRDLAKIRSAGVFSQATKARWDGRRLFSASEPMLSPDLLTQKCRHLQMIEKITHYARPVAPIIESRFWWEPGACYYRGPLSRGGQVALHPDSDMEEKILKDILSLRERLDHSSSLLGVRGRALLETARRGGRSAIGLLVSHAARGASVESGNQVAFEKAAPLLELMTAVETRAHLARLATKGLGDSTQAQAESVRLYLELVEEIL